MTDDPFRDAFVHQQELLGEAPFDTGFDPNDEAQYEGLYGLDCSPEQSKMIVLPVPFDATASYRKGAADGPEAILQASWQVELRDVETEDPWKQGICMLPIDPDLKALNTQAHSLMSMLDDRGARSKAISQLDSIGQQVADWVSLHASTWLDRDKFVAVLGGDHSCPLGLIEQLANRHSNMGVLHIDAHADLRNAYQGLQHSHASIMHNVLERVAGVAMITQVSVRDLCADEMRVIGSNHRVRCFYDVDVAHRMFDGEPFSSIVRDIVSSLPERVYVSFDIDGLDPSLCPNTGTPVPGGLSFHQACYLLREVVRSGRQMVGFDLCEVAPGPIDALVGARILYKLIGWLLASVR